MKVLPYLSVIQGNKQTSIRRETRRVKEQTLDKASPMDKVEVVSLENRRAVSELPHSLNEAEKVLEQVNRALQDTSKNELRKLHRLEGLVQVFSTRDG